jgi:hypothetical protein
VSKAVRILAPHIVAGVYTPEELQDVETTVVSAAPKATKKAVAPAPVASPEPTPVAAAADPTIVDAEFTVTPEPVAVVVEPEAPKPTTVDDSNEPTTPELIQELVAVTSQFPGENGARITAEEIHRRLCAFAGVDSPNKATRGQIRSLIARCREALSR